MKSHSIYRHLIKFSVIVGLAVLITCEKDDIKVINFPKTPEEIKESLLRAQIVAKEGSLVIDNAISKSVSEGVPVNLQKIAESIKQIDNVLNATPTESGTGITVELIDRTCINLLVVKKNDERLFEIDTPKSSTVVEAIMKNTDEAFFTPNGSGKALILAPFQNDFETDLDKISQLLHEVGYIVYRKENSEADLDSFRGDTLNKYDVVYINTHGLADGHTYDLKTQSTLIETGEQLNYSEFNSFPEEERNALALMGDDVGYYAVTVPWLELTTTENYTNSWIFIDACESARIKSGLASLSEKFLTLGAGGYSGWNTQVWTEFSNPVAELMFEKFSSGLSFADASDAVRHDPALLGITLGVFLIDPVTGLLTKRSNVFNFKDIQNRPEPFFLFEPVKTITSDPIVVTCSKALVGGNVTSIDDVSVIERGIYYGAEPNPEITGNKIQIGSGVGSFSTMITGLNYYTLYYTKAYAKHTLGTSFGSEIKFMIPQATSVPIVSTTPVTDYSFTKAFVGGNVISDGGDPIIERGVFISTQSNPGTTGGRVPIGSGTGVFSTQIEGLLHPYTNYYIQAYAMNSCWTATGEVVQFTTDHGIELPQVVTHDVPTHLITNVSASFWGIILFDGGSPITKRGMCWSMNENPTLGNSNTSECWDPTIPGGVTSDTSGGTYQCWTNKTLTSNTTYYVRAYATNIMGTAYGEQLCFTTASFSDPVFNSNLTYGMISDIEGNTYKTIQIGTQTWMAENLRATKFNDGSNIPLITNSVDWDNMTSPAYCWYDNDSKINAYGALYNWYTISSEKLCPQGWHIPDDSEWTTLNLYLGGENIAGSKLKEVGYSHWWSSPTAVLTNESGFTALPGGFRYRGFNAMGYGCVFWSTSMFTSSYGRFWSMYYEDNTFKRSGGVEKERGISVRCMKNQ